MEKETVDKSMIGEDGKKKESSEASDFFQLLKNNGMFVDCVSPVREAMEEIEKQLK